MTGKAEEKRRERRLWEGAVLAAYAALINRYGKGRRAWEIAEEALGAADEFMAAINKRRGIDEYEATIDRLYYIPCDLEDIIEGALKMDGYSRYSIDLLVKRFMAKPDPLRAFAEDTTLPRTFGQKMIKEFLKQQDNAA